MAADDAVTVPRELAVSPGVHDYRMAEFLLDAGAPAGTELDVSPYWGEEGDTLYLHFDVYEEQEEPGRLRRAAAAVNVLGGDVEEVRRQSYQFQVEIPQESWIHPENPDYRLEPELPALSRRRFLKGMGLGAAAATGITGATIAVQEDRTLPYEEAVSEARDLVETVRRVRRQGSDRSSLYLGNVNSYQHWLDETDGLLGPVGGTDIGMLDDGEMTVEIVYLDEDLDADTYLERLGARGLDHGKDMLRAVDLLQETQFDHHLGPGPLHSGGGGGDASDIIRFLREYYQEFAPVVREAVHRGDDYIDEQVSRLDRDLLREAGERTLEECRRADTADDIAYELSLSTEPLGRNEPLSPARSELADQYGDRTTFPVFVTARTGGDAMGWATPDLAQVHLPLPLLLYDDPGTEDSIAGRLFLDTFIMEVVHGLYRAPHTADRYDSMSYNLEQGIHTALNEVPGIGPISQDVVQRYTTGGLVEHGGDRYLSPGRVPDDEAARHFGRNLSYFLDDMMGLDLDRWTLETDPADESFSLHRDEEGGRVTVTGSIDGFITDIDMETSRR